jgi:hypothetical protein
MMCADSSTQSTPNTLHLALGVALVIVGAVLTLDVFGIGNAERLLGLWPAALVFAGVVGLRRTSDSGGRLWSWALVVIGGWLLLRAFGLTDVGFWELVWPIAIIAFGVKLWLDARGQRVGEVRPAPVAANASHLVAILAGTKRAVHERPFRGASMTSILGGCELDLRHADIPPGTDAVIEVFGLFGGHEMNVPDAWTVVSQVTCIAAGVDDQRGIAPTPNTDPNPRRLVIKGILLFSGLTIRR